jgi:hypothetical protein
MAETIFDESTLGTVNNQITFNQDGPIYYRLRSRLPQRRQIREFDIPLQENTGIADFRTFIGKTMFILEGTMYPDDEDYFAEGRYALKSLASPQISQDDADSDQGYVPYKWVDNDAKQIFVKELYVDLPESSRGGIKQPFKLWCKLKYPVVFSQTIESTTLGQSTSTTSGGSFLPFTMPEVLGSTTYSSNGSISNLGKIGTYPTITIYGPINQPRITNSTTSEYLEFNCNLNLSTDVLRITYDQDTLRAELNGNSVINKQTSGSTYFKLISGINNLTLSGSVVSSGAYATVTANSAWPIS